MKKNLQVTQTPILLNVENNGLFLLDFHWSFKIFTYLTKPVIHLTITSFKIIGKKIQTTRSNNFIAHNIFSSHLQPSLFNTLYILLINWYLYPVFVQTELKTQHDTTSYFILYKCGTYKTNTIFVKQIENKMRPAMEYHLLVLNSHLLSLLLRQVNIQFTSLLSSLSARSSSPHHQSCELHKSTSYCELP